MNNLTINIGLNVNNNEPNNQKELTLKTMLKIFSPTLSKTVEGGEWNGIKERIQVYTINAGELNSQGLKLLLSWLCVELNQDAIAFKLNNEGRIAFSPFYNGEKFQFNNEKFLNF